MWDTAVTAMVAFSALGFFIADGEMRRVRWIQAMRRCLLRMNSMIRYERPTLGQMLAQIELRNTAGKSTDSDAARMRETAGKQYQPAVAEALLRRNE